MHKTCVVKQQQKTQQFTAMQMSTKTQLYQSFSFIIANLSVEWKPVLGQRKTSV